MFTPLSKLEREDMHLRSMVREVLALSGGLDGDGGNESVRYGTAQRRREQLQQQAEEIFIFMAEHIAHEEDMLRVVLPLDSKQAYYAHTEDHADLQQYAYQLLCDVETTQRGDKPLHTARALMTRLDRHWQYFDQPREQHAP